MVLSDRLVFIGTNFSSQDEVFHFAAEQLCATDRAQEPQALVDGFRAREKEYSTYIENGVAIPHCKIAQVQAASAVVLCNQSDIQWSDEGEYADLIILLAVPDNNPNNLHLKILAKLAQSLMDKELVHKLKTMSEPAQINEVLKAVNEMEQREVLS